MADKCFIFGPLFLLQKWPKKWPEMNKDLREKNIFFNKSLRVRVTKFGIPP